MNLDEDDKEFITLTIKNENHESLKVFHEELVEFFDMRYKKKRNGNGGSGLLSNINDYRDILLFGLLVGGIIIGVVAGVL